MLKEKYFLVFVLLVAITLFSFFLPQYMALGPKFMGALFIALAFVKVQLIISQYMELGRAIVAVRIVFWLWTTAAGASTIVVYLR